VTTVGAPPSKLRYFSSSSNDKSRNFGVGVGVGVGAEEDS
jgi:hypothetical protein